MRITFLGGADEVGASSILIEMSGRRLLVDAGIRPSPKVRWGLAGDQLPDLSQVDHAGGVDAILVTHAHTDHTGGLELVAERYRCPVYATPITVALTRVLHADSRRIMRTRLEEEGELPLFDDVAVQRLLDAFVPVPFNTRMPLGGGMAATFFPAGHIAGAAMIGLEGEEGRVLISGDVSVSPQRTVDGLKPPPFQPDVLMMESTYGGRLHANRTVEERRLVTTVNEVTGAGGKVLIPAFALGRAQELILILTEFRKRGEHSTPVWVDGMVRAICQAYAQFPESLPLALQERGAMFFDDHTRPVERPDQRNTLIWQPDPVVVIASSGMLAGGASVEYARALAKQPQNAILLTGYQDEESPGRRLQEIAARGASGSLKLGKDRVDVQCRLGTYALSAHADEGQLISLVEALDPAEVLLVHGDEAARASLAAALTARKRIVRLPHTGQSLEFQPHRPLVAQRPSRIGTGRPLDLRALWQEVAGPAGGGYFTSDELARGWWGDPDRVDELQAELEKDDLYFAPDPQRPSVYRARTSPQIDLSLKRRESLARYPDLVGQWLILRDPQGEGMPGLARCETVEVDRFYVECDPSPHWPEELIEVIEPGESPLDLAAIESLAATLDAERLLPPGAPRTLDEIMQTCQVSQNLTGLKAAIALALLRAGAGRTPDGYVRKSSLQAETMEPNQALSFVRAQFPPQARLRRCGYRLDGHVITLAFDLPDAAASHFGDIIQRLPAETGWQVEIDPEANQGALAELAREVLASWTIAKGPAIHREEKRVAVTITGIADEETATRVREHFHETSGYDLVVTVAGRTGVEPVMSAPASGSRMEINAAYAAIKDVLAGSTLYRTSLTGDTIVLSFISPQVGERHSAEIEVLSQRIGWPLAVNPQPNQGAILEAARKLVANAGWEMVKGPGIHVDSGEVEIRLAALPDEGARAQANETFEVQTGYQLAFAEAASPAPGPTKSEPAEVVEIPIDRIRLTAAQQRIVLSQDKTDKAIERARRIGKISPPVQVRRLRDGYLLLDGLYRLQAARAMGWDRIAAVVEG